MKISVVGLASRSGGGLTVLKELFEFANSPANSHQWQFVLSDQQLVANSDLVRSIRVAENYKGLRTRIWAEATKGRQVIKSFDPDVVISLQNVDTLARGNKPLGIYMHQALPFQNDFLPPKSNFSQLRSALRLRLIKSSILTSMKRAQITFVQTQWLAEALKKRLPGVDIEAIGFQQRSPTVDLQAENYFPNGFFYPSSALPYKNHVTLHQSLLLIPDDERSRLGKIALTITREQFKSVVGDIQDDDIEMYEFLGWISSTEVEKRYSSSILVFPSLVESLGLPLYEARAKGIRIVAARNAFSVEALEGYDRVVWFNATDPQSLANALVKATQFVDNGFSTDPFLEAKPNCWELMTQHLEERCGRLS